MAKIEYSSRVYKSTSKVKIKVDIVQAAQSNKEARKEIARVFQMANRRIQNIENAGLVSPAVAALNKGNIPGYSKFSMSGDWNTLKIEYGKAVSFLRQPTSTASGVRAYNKHIMDAYDLTQDEFNMMSRQINNKISSLAESDFVERYLMRYKDFTGELEASARDISTQIESEARSIQRSIDESIERAARQAEQETKYLEDKINEMFSNFGL